MLVIEIELGSKILVAFGQTFWFLTLAANFFSLRNIFPQIAFQSK